METLLSTGAVLLFGFFVYGAVSMNCTDPFITICGKIHAKVIDPTDGSLLRIVVEATSRATVQTLVLTFDCKDVMHCDHSDRSQCFHGLGCKLEQMLNAGDQVVVRISRNEDGPRQVYQLMSPHFT